MTNTNNAPDEPVQTVWKVEIVEGVFREFSSQKDAQLFASLDKAAKMERLLRPDFKGSTKADT